MKGEWHLLWDTVASTVCADSCSETKAKQFVHLAKAVLLIDPKRFSGWPNYAHIKTFKQIAGYASVCLWRGI